MTRIVVSSLENLLNFSSFTNHQFTNKTCILVPIYKKKRHETPKVIRRNVGGRLVCHITK